MPADTSSNVCFPRGRSGLPGVSLGAATLRLPAASLGGSFPVRAPEAGLLAAPPGMSPRAPEADSQSSCTPLPRPSPHPRAPPRSATASGQEASGKRRPGSQGPEGGPEKRGKGLGFPDNEPLEAGRREISVRFWKIKTTSGHSCEAEEGKIRKEERTQIERTCQVPGFC
ncbi:translation initiation factor IF-2-like [Lontra canadensis]|uniref:translation initiation factor IF-2-like n=1 Tax=Lontra canadensis TaxID=76717 RepID=UPI0013F2D94D|nr:translation initiation factor IF-2-like [Lontra canadensis]